MLGKLFRKKWKSHGQKWKEKYFEIHQELETIKQCWGDTEIERARLLRHSEELEKVILSCRPNPRCESSGISKYLEELEKEVAYWKEKALNFRKFHQ